MKNHSNLSTIFLQIFFLVAVLFGPLFLLIGSCNSIKGRDSKTIARELNEERFKNSEDKKNADCLVDIAEMHLREIHLARLAQKNAKYVDVKELGKMFEKINSKTLLDLEKLANKKSISIPDSTTLQGLQAAEFLNKKSGHSFDKEYCDMLVVSQKYAIKVLEGIVEETTDAEIKIWAFCTLPAMRKHLQYALKCQEKYAKI